jgi:hypothetical protein
MGEDLVPLALGPATRGQPARNGRRDHQPRYLISLDDGSMNHIPDEDRPAVGESAHAVVQEGK